MKLVYAQASPFVRKVMVVVEEAGQRDSVELVDGFGSPVAPSENALAANPLGKIPCLILDDGTSMYDSRVITRYLNDKFGLSLYPSGRASWPHLTLEAHADAILDAGVLCVYEARCRDKAIHSTEWLEAQRGKINRALDAIETQWMPYLSGDLTIAHIGVGCAVEYLDFRAEMGGFSDWREARPQLHEWATLFSNRSSMKATVPA